MRPSIIILTGLALIICVAVPATYAPAAQVKRRHVVGEVMAVSPDKKAILVRAGKLKVGAEVDEKTVISIKGRKGTLADIKVGDEVEMSYTRNLRVIARTIRIVSTRE